MPFRSLEDDKQFRKHQPVRLKVEAHRGDLATERVSLVVVAAATVRSCQILRAAPGLGTPASSDRERRWTSVPCSDLDGVPNERPTPPGVTTSRRRHSVPSKAHAIGGLWLALALELQLHPRADRGWQAVGNALGEHDLTSGCLRLEA